MVRVSVYRGWFGWGVSVQGPVWVRCTLMGLTVGCGGALSGTEAQRGCSQRGSAQTSGPGVFVLGAPPPQQQGAAAVQRRRHKLLG